MKKPRDPLMKHADNESRLKAFRVVEGGVTRKPRVERSFYSNGLRLALLVLVGLITFISIPWFVGVWTIATGIWDTVFNRG